MRRFVVALLGLSAMSGAAIAADMPAKAPARILPPPILVYNWTGCYIGGHAGGGWGRTEWTNTANTTTFGDLSPGNGFTQTKSGFVGGGQIGCNYQINQWVFGIEGTIAGTSIKGDVANGTFGAADDVFSTRIDFIATVVGRIGYAFNNWLPYIKGGYAGADVKFSVNDTVAPNIGSGSETNWLSGWTIGGGLEYGITPNWIVGVEYGYIGLQTKSYNVAGTATGVYSFDVKSNIQQVVARLSYKF
jgi:outer membrane immunogenic protein